MGRGKWAIVHWAQRLMDRHDSCCLVWGAAWCGDQQGILVVPLLTLICSLTLGKSLHVSGPECLYLQNGTFSTCKVLWCKDENCCLREEWWLILRRDDRWILVVGAYAHCACGLFSSNSRQVVCAKCHPACRGLQDFAVGLLFTQGLQRVCKFTCDSSSWVEDYRAWLCFGFLLGELEEESQCIYDTVWSNARNILFLFFFPWLVALCSYANSLLFISRHIMQLCKYSINN